MTTTEAARQRVALQDVYHHADMVALHGATFQDAGVRLMRVCEEVAAWVAGQIGPSCDPLVLPDGYTLDHTVEGSGGVLSKDAEGETFFTVGSPLDGWDTAAALVFAGDIFSGWLGRVANQLNHRADQIRTVAGRFLQVSRAVPAAAPLPPPQAYTDGL